MKFLTHFKNLTEALLGASVLFVTFTILILSVELVAQPQAEQNFEYQYSMNYQGKSEFGALYSAFQMAAHEEELILVQKDLSYKKKELTIEGIIFDVHGRATKDFKVHVPANGTFKSAYVKKIDCDNQFLVLNVLEAILVLKKNSIGEFQFHNKVDIRSIRSDISVCQGKLYLIRNGFLDKSIEDTSRMEYNIDLETGEIDSLPYSNTKDVYSNILNFKESDVGSDFCVRVSPIDYDIQIRRKESKLHANGATDKWIELDPKWVNLHKINRDFSIMSELRMDFYPKISVIENIRVLNQKEFIVEYSTPNDSGYKDIFIDLWEVKRDSCIKVKEKINLANWNHISRTEPFTIDSAVPLIGLIGRFHFITKDYLYVLAEEPNIPYLESSIQELTNRFPNEERVLRLHVFKHEF